MRLKGFANRKETIVSQRDQLQLVMLSKVLFRREDHRNKEKDSATHLQTASYSGILSSIDVVV
jgi:hypothetical protein